MINNFEKLREYIKVIAHDTNFVHNPWYIKWHLEIVEKMSLELCEIYTHADKDIVLGLVWMHDHAKLIDRPHEHDSNVIEKGRVVLEKLGFDKEYTDKLIEYINIFESKMTEDLSKVQIEIQIVSSADAASHFVGPFYNLWWYEHSDKTIDELMEDNRKKALKDWNRKVTLPEVKSAFESRFNHTIEQSGSLPQKYFNTKQGVN